MEEEGVRRLCDFFPSAAIALLLSPSSMLPTPPSASHISCASEGGCTMQIEIEDVEDLLTTGSKEGSAMIGERRNPFFRFHALSPSE